MTRGARALQNAGLSIGVIVGYGLTAVLAHSWSDPDELFGGVVVVGCLFVTPWVFLGSYVLDAIAARLPHRVARRALVVTLLVAFAVAFAIYFDREWLARDDSRAILGWLLVPAACVFGFLLRLPPVPGQARAHGHRDAQPG